MSLAVLAQRNLSAEESIEVRESLAEALSNASANE